MMNAEEIIKGTVEQAVTKAMRETLNTVSDKLVENISTGINKPKYAFDDMLTEQELSEYLQIALPTLRKWRSEKQNIPYIMLSNKAVRYRFEDVYNFLLSKRVRVI